MTNLAKMMILICISSLVFVCGKEKQQSDNNLKAIGAVNPEQIYVTVSENANYMDDFSKSIRDGDLRFTGIMGYALIVPGVLDYYKL